MRRDPGAGGNLGKNGKRMGDRSEVSVLRRDEDRSRNRKGQQDQNTVDRIKTDISPAFPGRADRRADPDHGRQRRHRRKTEMNRENKKRKYDKKYYRTHPCTDSFTCKICGWPVVSAGAGTNHRNHCPNCLYSIHLDNEPGDRESECHGRMEPIGVWVRKNGEWAIIHRCIRCGKISSNRVAADDNPMKLMALAMRPFGSSVISRNEIREMTLSMEER